MNTDAKKCPKCDYENPQHSIECIKCGIVFEKYKKSRDIEFGVILQSFHNDSLESIKSKFDKLVNKYPDLSNSCRQFMLIAEQAVFALNSKEFSRSIDLFRDLKLKYPGYTEEADRHIKQLEERKDFQDIFDKGVKAFQEDRFLDAKSILQKLKEEHSEHQEIDEYLNKIAKYINIEDPPSKQPVDNLPKCPRCGASNIQAVAEGEIKGFSAGKGCCGATLLGPFGFLCGLCGMGKGKTKAVRMCVDCGKKF